MVSPTASTDELLEQSASYRLSVSEVSTVIKLCQEIKSLCDVTLNVKLVVLWLLPYPLFSPSGSFFSLFSV